MYEYHGNKGSRRQQEIKEPLTLYRAGGFLFISCRRYQTDHLQIYSGGVRILNVQLEQYEQFIRLLVKVRAPKLSKEFKPTKVYEILNDSLQTLTDEDLRAMVDAMEKMDEIQDSLEMLNRAFDDVKIIRNEYTRYNQYMLAKKAQAYMAKRQEVSGMQQQLEKQEQEIKETKERKKAPTG